MVTAELLESQPDCFMVALRVQHSDSEKCSQKLKQLKTFLTGFDGFSNLSVIRRDGGLGTDFYIIVRFDSIDALQAWRSAPETVAMAKEIEAMAITDISRQHASGASIWFEPVSSMPSTPKPPLFWKRWVTSMLAVYPALVVLVAALNPVTSHLPKPVGLFVIALILTGLNTAFIVPWLTRTLHRWLVAR